MKHAFLLILSALFFCNSYAQPKGTELSHYLFPEFTRGIIMMKTGIRQDALLNYNSITEEMVFDSKGKKLAIGKEDLEQVDTVIIRDRKFFTINNKFVELLYHSKCDLYAEHRCRVKSPGKTAGYGETSETSAINSYSSFSSGAYIYELQLPEGYETTPYIMYWLKRNNELKKILNMSQLKKSFSDKKDLFNAYLKDHTVKYDNQESIIQLIKHLESD